MTNNKATKSVRPLAKAGVLLLAISLLLAACSGKGSTSSEGQGTGDTLTFSMLYSDNSAYPYNKNWPVLQQMTEKTNVKLEMQTVPDTEYAGKLKLVLNSGSAPDLIALMDQNAVLEFAQTGVLLPISDYMDKLPNLQQKIEQYRIEEELNEWKLKDGKLYVLPFMNESAIYNRGPVIRKDLLDRHQLQIPTTSEELYTVLKKLKEADPKSFPMTNLFGADQLLANAGPSWGIGPSYNGFMLNPETNRYEYVYTGENYKQYVKYLNKLVTEGIADPELFTSSLDQWKQKMATGKSVFSYTWLSEVGQLNADGKKNVSTDFELVPLPPIAGPGGAKTTAANRIYHGIGIPAGEVKKPYFDKLLEYVNWLYSDEAIDMMTWGVKDQTYIEKDGRKDFPEEMKKTGIQRALWDIGASNNNYLMVFPYEWFMKTFNDPVVETLTEEANANDWFPAIAKMPKLTSEQREEEKMLLTSINDLFLKVHEQFVYGKLSLDTEWDRYVQDINAKGVSKLLELYNSTVSE
ncbi:extracellular solute-binding protein [Paenibacillus sp. MSJ-34]|uniref:extracellular solute-binding protein n=1 Tax=Paenibacillus sp. MSJ-34 TaxID=2841529 RepID=UPI001C1203FE|nr:extracellular solute-binding protein [Paenibacillus sp. MSJ-34]MBU5445113.1 extracellular solute-binding protein [Paenibacillus sp. MSJ-34]